MRHKTMTAAVTDVGLRVSTACLSILWLLVQGCSFPADFLDSRDNESPATDTARRIEVEIHDPERGLPCSVVYRPDSSTKEVLWHARFEKGFCHKKADEARFILETRGWACQIEAPDDRSKPGLPDRGQNVVAAWRCEQGTEAPAVKRVVSRPALPAAGHDNARSPLDQPADPALRAVIEEDLATRNQTIFSRSEVAAVAYGDLDQDDQTDAVVVLTHESDRQRQHRIVMAYLGNDQTYHLADVQILPAPTRRNTGDLTVDIEDGAIRLTACCGNGAEPTILALRDRELVYSSESEAVRD